MHDTPHHEPHHRPHAPPLSGQFLEFDLTSEVHRLQAETTWSTGQNAKTLVKYDDLRIVLMVLRAGNRLPEHKSPGRISVQVLSGHVQVKAANRTFSLRTGGLIALDKNEVHDVEALEDSACVLTIAWPGNVNSESP